MKLSDLRKSNYLTQKDVADGEIIVTVESIKAETVGQGENKEEKFVCYFKELDKGLILNATNGETLSLIAGSDEGDDWVGARAALYFDPAVRYGGQRVGGLRLRPLSPREQQENPQLQPQPVQKVDDGADTDLAPTRRLSPAQQTAEVLQPDDADSEALPPQVHPQRKGMTGPGPGPATNKPQPIEQPRKLVAKLRE